MTKQTTYLKNGQEFFQIGATGTVVAIMGSRIQAWTQDNEKTRAAINYAMGKGKPASKYEFESALRKAMDLIAEALG